MRIVTVTLAAHHERVDHGGTVAGIGMADEEPVFRAELARPDGVLDRVGVECGVAVAEVRGERFSVAEQIRAGLAEAGLRQYAVLQRRRQPTPSQERAGKVLLAQCGALLAGVGLVPLALECVESPDQPQDAFGGLGPLTRGLEEASPRVGPTSEPLDADMGAHKGGIGFIAVRLEQAAVVVTEQPLGFLVPPG